MEISYKCIPFQELSLEELYSIMRLRQEVFVVEQDCPYLDADGLDQSSLHVLGMTPNGAIVAYTRLLPKGILYEDYAAIGRVVTHPSIRSKGIGNQLMKASISALEKQMGFKKIKISAQYHLIAFYQTFGFEPIGEQYLEDNIPHIAMIRKAKPTNPKLF